MFLLSERTQYFKQCAFIYLLQHDVGRLHRPTSVGITVTYVYMEMHSEVEASPSQLKR